MNLILFGATGQIGLQILRLALAHGYKVTAFVRDPGKLDVTHPNLTVVEGDVRDPAAVAAVMPGHEAVVSALGPGGPEVSGQYLDILTDGTRHLVEGMRAAGLRHIVALGSVATLNVTQNKMPREMPNFPKMAWNISGAHLESLEMLQASGLDWTVRCPPSTVEPSERTSRYRVQADFVLNEVERGGYIGHWVNIAY